MEIALHSLSHDNHRTLSLKAFSSQLVESLHILEDIVSEPVVGYRAPCFNLPANYYEFLRVLESYGFIYDSSISLAKRYNFSNLSSPTCDSLLTLADGCIVILPIPCYKLGNFTLTFSGGSWMRLLPSSCLKYFSNLSSSDSLNCYLHPYEVDLYHKVPLEAPSFLQMCSHNLPRWKISEDRLS